MFSKSAPNGALPKSGKPGAPGLSFIGPEVVIRGDVATTAQLHVEGRIEGNVECIQLCQGQSGVIAGDITADDARLAGEVQGTVSAATVEVEASARLSGDVHYESISVASGARVDGRLARREVKGAQPAEAKAADPKVEKAGPDAPAVAEPLVVAEEGSAPRAVSTAGGPALFPLDEKQRALG